MCVPELGVSGVAVPPEQGKVEQGFFGISLHGFAFVVWFLLVEEAKKWKAGSSDQCWRRKDGFWGRLAWSGQALVCCVVVVEVGDNLVGRVSHNWRSWWR